MFIGRAMLGKRHAADPIYCLGLDYIIDLWAIIMVVRIADT